MKPAPRMVALHNFAPPFLLERYTKTIAATTKRSMIMRMFGRRFLSEQSRQGRGTRLLLIAFILFALWHVSQHDVESGLDANSGGHCDICRLNHSPSTGGAAQVLFAAVMVSATPQPAVDVPHLRSKSYLPRLARGPPLF